MNLFTVSVENSVETYMEHELDQSFHLLACAIY